MPAFASLFSALLLSLAAPGGAGQQAGAWPVSGPDGAHRPLVVRAWQPPPEPWDAGHRGVDLATAPGAAVRAAAGGRVSFAGRVAGRGVVSIELAGTGTPPLRTTYEPVRPLVAAGERVRTGQLVAELAPGPFHCPDACLHWGLLRGSAYHDPLSLLPPGLLGQAPSRLLPLAGVPVPREPAAPAPAAGQPPAAPARRQSC